MLVIECRNHHFSCFGLILGCENSHTARNTIILTSDPTPESMRQDLARSRRRSFSQSPLGLPCYEKLQTFQARAIVWSVQSR